MQDRLRRILVAFAAAGLLGGAVRAAPARAYAFNLSVTGQTVTRPISSSFLGLALEYGTVPQWTSADGHADPILPVLIRNLNPSGRPSLRIGGQSAERSWWPVPGMRRPVGVTQSLGEPWVQAARELQRETDARLLLGINFEAGSARLTQVEADQLVKRIGAANIQALQLGNEPDLYRTIPWYRMQNGQILPWYAKTGVNEYSRPLGWSPSTYAAQVASFAARLPRLPLSGPDTVPGPWTTAFAGLRHSRVQMLTSHAYGLNNCVTNPALPGYPSIPHLLTLFASRGMYDGVAQDIALAHREGRSYRLDEMGSITCNGRPGVSNTFASALWAMDALFRAARIGVDGVNLHSYPNSANGLFDLTYDQKTHAWRATIHPLYDGVLMFAQAAPAGSRLLHITSSDQTLLRAWATLGSDGSIRVLLVNDSPDQAAQVRLRDPAGYQSSVASVERLQAPSAGATGRVTIGGRRFGSTLTGTVPAPALTTLAAHGAYRTIGVPAASAALITIPGGGLASRLSSWLALPVTALGYSCQSESSIHAICARSSLPTVSTW